MTYLHGANSTCVDTGSCLCRGGNATRLALQGVWIGRSPKHNARCNGTQSPLNGVCECLRFNPSLHHKFPETVRAEDDAVENTND